MKEKQIQTLLQILDRCEALKNINSVNCGSAHKSKDEIINYVCSLSREGIQVQSLIISAIQWLWFSDYSFEQFIEHQISECERTNQPEIDRVERRAILDQLAEMVVEV